MRKIIRAIEQNHPVVFAIICGFFSIIAAVAWSGGQIYGQALRSTGSHRWESRIDGVAVWVTQIGPKALIKHDSAQGWDEAPISPGVTYLISTNRPSDIRVAIVFTHKHNRSVALFYDGANLPKNVIPLARDESLDSMPPAIRVTTKMGGWIVDGQVNYSFQFQSYDGTRLISQSASGSLKPGVPSWETGRSVFNPHPTDGISRFGAAIRLPGAPPVDLQSSFFHGFPLFGVGIGQNINWFVNNPSPFFLNLNTGQMEENSTVGFEDGGVYRFNSLSYPPYVDFESPFAFYTFTHSRNAELVVRAQQFPKGDLFGPAPTNIQRSYFRLSWKMGNTGDWTYSVSVQGFHPYHSTIHLGKTSLLAPLPSRYPQWVISKVWPYRTFVQSMAGYPGSEGIYFDSGGSAPPVWPWLAGFSVSPPQYLVDPYLPKLAVLSHVTSMALPPDFRMESSSEAERRAVLYVSPIDDLVHLVGATSGIWNLGHGRVLREENLTQGNYLDAWILDKVPKHAKTAEKSTAIESLYATPPYLVYASKHKMIIKKAFESLSDFTIAPPTNRQTWINFTHKIAPYQKGRNPENLSSWLAGFHGLSSTLKNVTIVGRPRIQANDFSLVMRINRLINPSVQMPGLALTEIGPQGLRHAGGNLSPGIYVLNYNKSSGWTIRSATLPSLSAKVTTRGPLRSLHTNELTLTVDNHGTSRWYGTIRIGSERKIVGSETGWIDGSSGRRFNINWSPTSGGKQQIVVRVGRKVIGTRDVSVITTPRGTIWSLWPLSIPQGIPIDGILDALVAILIVGGSVVTWRRLTLG